MSYAHQNFLQNEYCAEIGLTNFGNNCWFNAVIQAVQRVLPRSGSREMIQRYAEHTVEGIIHRLVSKTQAKDGSLLAAIKSVCEKFQWNINEHQGATEFYMKYSFDTFISENSVSTSFTVNVSGECRKCSRVAASESSIHTVLTIPVCYNISGKKFKFPLPA